MARKLVYEQFMGEVQKIENTYHTYTLARRHPPSIEVNRYGRARTNVEGAEEWMAFFDDQKIDPRQPWITTGFNKARGLIFMYAAEKTEAGAIEVKWDAANRTYSTHFGAAMRECPPLRPVATVAAQAKPSLDKDGKPCLIINIKAAKARRAGAADAEKLAAEAARAEAKAAKQAAKAAARERIAAAKKGRSRSGAQGAGEMKPPAEEQA